MGVIAFWLVANVFLIFPVIGTIWLAARRGRNPAFWGFLSFFISWIALAVLAMTSEVAPASRPVGHQPAIPAPGEPETISPPIALPLAPPRVRTLVLWLTASLVVTGLLLTTARFAREQHDPRLVTIAEDGSRVLHLDGAQALVLSHRRADGMTLEGWTRGRLAGLCPNLDQDQIVFQTSTSFEAPGLVRFATFWDFDGPLRKGPCTEKSLSLYLGAIGGIESKGARVISVFNNGTFDEDDTLLVTWFDRFEADEDP